jgi:hypothetical protein
MTLANAARLALYASGGADPAWFSGINVNGHIYGPGKRYMKGRRL